jgi:hypothetical protein
MHETYAIVWREGQLPTAAGKLELSPEGLQLDGIRASVPVASNFDYGALDTVRVGRAASDRLDGRPTVILEFRHNLRITIAAVVQPSLVTEIAERLRERRASGPAT